MSVEQLDAAEPEKVEGIEEFGEGGWGRLTRSIPS